MPKSDKELRDQFDMKKKKNQMQNAMDLSGTSAGIEAGLSMGLDEAGLSMGLDGMTEAN